MLIFGRYRLKKVLGRGGMGIVWLVQDQRLEREVALKLLPEMLFMDAAARDDLKRETRRSLELTHPNIVRIHDFIEDDQTAAISMEYIDGATLSQLRIDKPNKVFEAEELAKLLPGLCAALDYAHENARLVHRDLKPANIMLTSRGVLKVADFGIACSLMNSVNRVSMCTGSGGTISYMSPQQMQGDEASSLDDIYALGATLYELLTSKPPHHSGNVSMQVRESIPEPIATRRRALGITAQSLPEVWETTIAACLAKKPGQRPQNASEVLTRLAIGVRPFAVEIDDTVGNSKLIAIDAAQALKILFQKCIIPAVAMVTVVALLAGVFLLFHVSRSQEKTSSQPTKNSLSLEPSPLIAARPIVSIGQTTVPIAHGGLMVKTSPPGATVSIGGDAVETTPATFKGLPEGNYPLRIFLDGYEPVEMEAKIVANEFGDIGNIPLTRSMGAVQILSTPESCYFEITGTSGFLRKGETPETIREIPTGTYTARFQRPGWPESSQQFQIERRATRIVQWEFGQGQLSLTSDPVGATVTIEGKEMGKTPLVADLPAGSYSSIKVALAGYEPTNVHGEINSGKTTSIDSIALKKSFGTLVISSSPDHMDVFLDGNAIGATPLTTTVPAGEHEVNAHRKGALVRKRTVTVLTGEIQKIDFSFHSESSAGRAHHTKPPPPSTWSKIGQSLKNVFH